MPVRDDEDDTPRRDRFGDDDEGRDRPRRRKASGGFPTWAIVAIVLGVCCVVGVPGAAVMVGLLLPATQKVRDAAGRTKDANNLKVVGMGYHNHHDARGQATGPYATDPATGRPNTGLSHRVALLPYIEQEALYRSFDLSQPWDGGRNRPLADTVVQHFASPLDPAGTAATRYQAFVGPGTMYDPAKPRPRLADVTDGTSNTILMVTADDAVVWSKPQDLAYSPAGPLPSFGRNAFGGGTNVLMADGSVRFLKNTTPEPTVRALITRAGGEQLPPDW